MVGSKPQNVFRLIQTFLDPPIFIFLRPAWSDDFPNRRLPTTWVPSLTGIRDTGNLIALHLVCGVSHRYAAGQTLRLSRTPPKAIALRRKST